MTDFKSGDRVLRKRISPKTNPLAVGEVTAGDGRHATVKWPLWNARNGVWTAHKIRCETRALIPFDAEEYKRRHEMVCENVDYRTNNWSLTYHPAWDTPDAE